ncbi:uncharacterized protein LOC119836153 [Zerene cesonia]|uniref:uncharacterized protein LOC119836153 n=1 Tax=Zerene cesonia TaxID=33412 RepID=UPI0018E56051|nr:uncharacterized protein LOC119836153 [Zerene cesonia]
MHLDKIIIISDVLEEVAENLFSAKAYETPSDSVRAEDLVMKLPDWFDKKKHEQGREFIKNFLFGQSVSMTLGLISVFSIPTILEVLVGTTRSNTEITAYRRYWSTFSHIMYWFDDELKPGSKSWKSLHTVRSRHVRADRAAKLKRHGTVSQRDISLTLFGFIGITVLKPDKLGITQLKPGDWEGFNHFWAVLGAMIGLEDKYNICRKTFEETRLMCKIIQERIYTPCMENVPEYFEHSSRVMLDGMNSVNPAIEAESLMFMARYVSDVPGYVYNERDLFTLRDKIKKHLDGKPPNTGVDSEELMGKCPLKLSKRPPRLLYLQDYETVENSPPYKQLTFKGKYKLALMNIFMSFYSCFIGRALLNFHFKFYIFLGKYLPYTVIWRYGFQHAYSDIFKEDPADPTPPKPNSEYYKPKKETWYEAILSILW